MTYLGGTGNISPAANSPLRGSGAELPGSAGRSTRRWRRCAMPGSTREDLAAQQAICAADGRPEYFQAAPLCRARHV